MDFYTMLSNYYDEVFPASETEMAFVNGLLQGKTRLLDIGCGNGNKTVLLGTPANSVLGIDDDAGMIAHAQKYNAAPNINYAVMNMLEMGDKLKGNHFNGVLCLGNTLVHLPDKDAVERMLADVYTVLEPRGLFIIQILHYEWIIEGKVNELPFTETANVVFKRNYEWRQGRLHFCTTLKDKQSGAEFKGDIVLLPLLTAELADMLAKQGFVNISHYGDYQGGPLQKKSLASIVVCQTGD